MTDELGLTGAAPTATFPSASPPATPAGGRGLPAWDTAGLEGGVQIGPVRFRELAAVARVQRRVFRPRLAYGIMTLVLLWALPHVRFLVARRGDTVLGCAIGDRQDRQARVINLAVAPEARRQGVGRALLAALEAVLPAGDLLLMVEDENTPARALYESAGYAQVGVARDYYGRGRHGIWMQKRRAANNERGSNRIRT